MNKVKPITPDEIHKQQMENIPDAVFEALNSLIAKEYCGGSSSFTIGELAAEFRSKGITKIESWYYNFEPVYEAAGWTVNYYKPGYNESGDITWTLCKKR
jgi:hypothetical protein